MKQKILLLISILVATLSLSAAPLDLRQKNRIIADINKTTSSLRTISCTFTQTKHLSMLNESMKSTGKMYFSHPGSLRWEYTSPYKYLFILNGNKVYVGGKSRKDVIDTNSNRLFKEVARIMMATVTGKALSNTKDYTIDVTDAKTGWNVSLIPKKKEMRRMFSKIILNFTKKGNMLTSITLFENNKDRTVISLGNIITNKKLNESLFAIPK